MPKIDISMFVPMIALAGWGYLEVDTAPGTDGEFYVRCAFAAAASVAVATLIALYLMVSSSKDKTKIDVITPAGPGVEKATTETITHAQYDMQELKKYAGQQLFTLVLMCGACACPCLFLF